MKKSLEISQAFFDRPVLEVCPDLLGQFLVVKIGKKIAKLEITEIEAYDGPQDLACHASKGRTPRTEVLFRSPGCWYVYLCYGVHWLLNVVAGPVGYPAAILIRGAGDWKGPGILTRETKIDNRFNTKQASKKTGLWFEYNGERSKNYRYKATPRIGVDYAGEWAEKPYRFIKNGYRR